MSVYIYYRYLPSELTISLRDNPAAASRDKGVVQTRTVNNSANMPLSSLRSIVLPNQRTKPLSPVIYSKEKISKCHYLVFINYIVITSFYRNDMYK